MHGVEGLTVGDYSTDSKAIAAQWLIESLLFSERRGHNHQQLEIRREKNERRDRVSSNILLALKVIAALYSDDRLPAADRDTGCDVLLAQAVRDILLFQRA